MNSNQRILETFLTLYQGQSLSITETSERYDVAPRTTQRDFAAISEALDAHDVALSLEYDPVQQRYKMQNADELSPQEVLLIGKILLESRALTKVELEKTMNHLLQELSPESSKHIKTLMANELLNYYPLKHQEDLLQLIWDFSRYIVEKTVIAFYYRKNRGEVVLRKGLPVSLFFSEYYFYVLLYNPKYENYLIYRLDRFGEIAETSDRIKIPYKDRLEDGELRKKIHFMYAGKEVTFTFRFWGIVEAALDKLPNSKVIKEFDDASVIIEATAYDTGVIMWLLSQGKNVQVLSPPSFVDKVRDEIEDMLKRYTD
ncbi:WYL domain-containing protein [Enterococcus sp. 669A]|uniref:WYL domain-containing protein n=1 Tax=Candidatus Enterococcus moelleringii TaxID=2815325 RepID=A0ABS3LE55_9ENTE|nr:WYL domain-containing protein [Enterococcus sp. 669A]MBO1307904.1 WYL domain-containing protein [Enterococcus sp. 669A]